jgi:DNA-binding XRE family transcriptional regulator
LAADGCVRSNRLQVRLSSVDRAHLTKLAFYLETDAPVRDYFIGGVHRSEFQVTSNTLVEGLAAHGVVPRKTFILRWPNLLPDILLRHYLRGYVDGDGNFYSSDGYASFSLAGTQAFCLEARRYLASTLNLPAVRLRRNSKTWSLTYGGTRQVRRIQQFLYNDATVFLARKRAVKIKPAKLKAFRRERGLTKTRLCEEAGVSYQTVYRIESGWIRQDRGQGPPRGVHTDTLAKIASALGVEPSELAKAS